MARILIVDDSKTACRFFAKELEDAGHETEVAHTGEDALQLIRGSQYDLVLLDVEMPGMRGPEVLKGIRRLYSPVDLPVIMLSSHHEDAGIVEALTIGANDYVHKKTDRRVRLARIGGQLTLRKLVRMRDEFLSIASHDLKNPLGFVQGATRFVRKRVPAGTPMTERAADMLDRVENQSLHMQQIIEDFIEMQAAKDGSLHILRERLDLGRLLTATADDNRPYAATKSISIDLEVDDAVPAVSGDPSRLAQVAQNLVGNAIKFTHPGTRVLVTAAVRGDEVVVEVSDAGPGLTEEDLEQVFGRYQRLSARPTGGEHSTGLGLSICKQFVEAHGGAIGARNNEGPGATFWFSLPLSAEAVPAHEDA